MPPSLETAKANRVQKLMHTARGFYSNNDQYVSTVKFHNPEVSKDQKRYEPKDARNAAGQIHAEGLAGTQSLTESLTLAKSAESELQKLLTQVNDHLPTFQEHVNRLGQGPTAPHEVADILVSMRSLHVSFESDDTHFVHMKSHLASLHPDQREPVFEERSTMKTVETSLYTILDAVIAMIEELLDTARSFEHFGIIHAGIAVVAYKLRLWVTLLVNAQRELPRLSQDLDRLYKPYVAWRHGRRYRKERDIMEKYGTEEHQKAVKEFDTHFLTTVRGLPGMAQVKDSHHYHETCVKKFSQEGVSKQSQAQAQGQSAQSGRMQSSPQRPGQAHIADPSSQAGSSRHREQ